MSGPIDLEPGSSLDLHIVDGLMRAAFDPRYGEAWSLTQCMGILAMPGVWLTLARQGKKAVGFSLVRNVADEAELLLIAVDPKRRGSGIGRALLRAALSDAQARGAVTVHLEMREGNDALHLYASEGFAKIGERRDYYRGANGKLFNAQTFAKKLA